MKTISFHRKSIFIVVVLAFLVFERMAPVYAAESGALDGKTFVGELIKKGDKSGDKDALMFKAGTFNSSACDAYGFGNAPYTTKIEGDSVTFQVVTSNGKGDKMEWKGTVKGETLEATVVNKPKSGGATDFSIEGMLKP